MGDLAHNRFQTIEQSTGRVISMGNSNYTNNKTGKKTFKMEIKVAALILLDALGFTALVLSAITFNLSDAQKIITWLLAVAFGIIRIGIVWQNYKSKQLDNKIKEIDAAIKERDFKNKKNSL